MLEMMFILHLKRVLQEQAAQEDNIATALISSAVSDLYDILAPEGREMLKNILANLPGNKDTE